MHMKGKGACNNLANEFLFSTSSVTIFIVQPYIMSFIACSKLLKEVCTYNYFVGGDSMHSMWNMDNYSSVQEVGCGTCMCFP